MPTLMLPTLAVRPSFLTAMDEFRAEGRSGPDDNSMLARKIREFGHSWVDRDGFAAYTQALRADAEEETPRQPGLVPSTTWWWVDGDVYLGRIAVRHRLTNRLREVGGHIGYDVRPTARRQGHATAMLAAALPLAHELGIDPALITCEVNNIASRRVIEANGGRLEGARNANYRYWVPTA